MCKSSLAEASAAAMGRCQCDSVMREACAGAELSSRVRGGGQVHCCVIH